MDPRIQIRIRIHTKMSCIRHTDANLVLLLCRCAAGGRAALPGRDAGDGGGPAAAHGGAGQEGRPPAHLPAVPAAGARPTRGLQEAPRLPGRRSMVS
jgi:hypothetical protein